jgi:acyl-lipid omega-6 desaturase (Delta-12 desaturase)
MRSVDLSHRGHGDVWVMTVDEYRNSSRLRQLKYQLYRHPLFMFLIGPSALFILRQRCTYGIPHTWHRERNSVHVTNVGILVTLGVAWFTIGIQAFLLVHLPIMILGAAAGSWLFFVQPQFEDAYWKPHDQWDFVRAACDGSSDYRLPWVLQWFTGNIGFHHIHHLESRIPNYNLPTCYEAVPELRRAVMFGFWDSLRCEAEALG